MELQFGPEFAGQYQGEALVVGVSKGSALQGITAELNASLNGLIERLIASGEITGKQSEVTILHTCGQLAAERLVVVGLGEAGRDPLFALRRAAGAAARALLQRGCRSVGFTLQLQVPATVRPEQAARCLVEGVYTGLYQSGECKSKPDSPGGIATLALVGLPAEPNDPAVAAARAGVIAGEATNYARRLVNLPANELTPTRLAEEAHAIAQQFGLEVEVMDMARATALGMGAFTTVAKGSAEPACVIVLRYRKGANGPRVAFVGKGLTFDSGGISIKPSDKMETMKQDMAGGAAVLAALRGIAQLGLELDVMGIIPATENLPSGQAFKPGDVIRAMNGTTIEVISTDAEGRLILADALVYAVQQGATHIVDLATLTGAAIIALGYVATPVMGNDSALVEAVIDAGERAGERMWRLPLFPEYRSQLESKIADLQNVGGRPAGTIMGGWFLREFVGETAWVHLDIAGTAWSEKDQPHEIEGGTGAGTRTLIALAQRMAGGEI